MSSEQRAFGSGKGLLFIALALTVVGAIVYFNGAPKPSKASASGGPLDAFSMYGINPTTAALVKYRFADDSLSTVGTVSSTGTGAMTGIQASAALPGFSNIFGFWSDPSDGLTKLVYISKSDASASVVGSPLGPEVITGATAVHVPATNSYEVYAVVASDSVPFIINTPSGGTTGDVVPSEPFAARMTVLGSAITYGGEYDIPVSVKVMVGGATLEPFGDADLALPANVNDGNNPRDYILPSVYGAGTPIVIWAQSWKKTDSALSGTDNSHWTGSLALDSDDLTYNVMTLRNGDSVPTIPGFQDQASIEVYISDFVDPATHKVTLGPNQAIYLFELGSNVTVNPYTSPGSLSASQDFQDVVVLVTFAQDSDDLVTGTIVTGDLDGELRINPSNSSRAAFELDKADGGVITLDDLQQATAAEVDGSGTYYSGGATGIKIRPAGGGSQNGLTIDGAAYGVENQSTYLINSTGMTVRIYNDQLNGSGVPMGHWRIAIDTATTGSVKDGEPTDDPSSPDRLVQVDHKTGAITPLMILSRSYDSLASADGQTFYATFGNKVYQIDRVNQTETLLYEHASGSAFKVLEFAGDALYTFDSSGHTIVPLSTATGAVGGAAIPVPMSDLGTILFVENQSVSALSYD